MYGCYVFESRHGAPPNAVLHLRLLGSAASNGLVRLHKLSFKAHAPRHACGYALANRGHDTRALQAYLGHRNIQHTVRYSELSPTQARFWLSKLVLLAVSNALEQTASSPRFPSAKLHFVEGHL